MFPVVIIPREQLTRYHHRPWSELLRAAETKADGLALSEGRFNNSGAKVMPALERNFASLYEANRGSGIAYLYEQNW